MDTRVLRDPVNPAMAAKIQLRERDTGRARKLISQLLAYTYKALPGPPVAAAARLSARRPHDAVDRVSRLPDALLHNIVSRLPVKDAARTAALSRRWRGVWRSTPLVLVDSHLLAGTDFSLREKRRLPSTVSRVLDAHPGPFRYIHLTTISMEEFQGPLLEWLELLAAKGTQGLVLANRPWPLDLQLPAALFSIATLTSLYLALCKFPDTAGLPRTASFPNLRELGLCTVVLQNSDMDFILANCPLLETLCLQSNLLIDRLTINSRSLRFVHVIASSGLQITVEAAPLLESLLVWAASTCKGSRTAVEIGHAPALSLLGYLEPEVHALQLGLGGTTIKTGKEETVLVSAVKVLALKVRFGVRNEAKILPCLLKCFPNVERLHIESKKTAESSKITLDLLEQFGAIKCISSHVKLMIFQNFRGDDSEICFLKFFLKSAAVLSKLVIVYDKEAFDSLTEVSSRLLPVFDVPFASSCWSLRLVQSTLDEANIRSGLAFM